MTKKNDDKMNVLHVAAEVFPLVKTGGLGDVAAALPAAMRQAGTDTRLLLPGYPSILDGLVELKPVLDIGPVFGAARVRLLQGRLAGADMPAYAIEAPYLYQRSGNPYQQSSGAEWSDNLQRFALLGWVAAQLAAGRLDEQWSPDVLHAHDWHAGLTCAYAHAHPAMRTATVFTVHNLAFQGLFPLADFPLLGLPSRYAGTDGIEFHGDLSFMKAGLQLADRVTTVSPTYAREIATPEFGCRMEGVIRSRGAAVSGILNGIDMAQWNPQADPSIAAPYDARSLKGKAACKRELQRVMGLELDAQAPLFCIVSRLSDQKGLDLMLGALPALLEQGAQLALQGTGDPVLEQAFQAAARASPGRVSVRIGYDEVMAHRLIAGADAIVVPSRFEPCGLTQLCGLRYGTLPVVRRVGGLADTVTDATPAALREGRATGFVFEDAKADALAQALQRAAVLYRRDTDRWHGMVMTAMARDSSWNASVEAYLQVYRAALADRA